MDVHFWTVELSGDDDLGKAHYKVGEDVPTNLSGWANIITTNPRFISSKVVQQAVDSKLKS